MDCGRRTIIKYDTLSQLTYKKKLFQLKTDNIAINKYRATHWRGICIYIGQAVAKSAKSRKRKLRKNIIRKSIKNI